MNEDYNENFKEESERTEDEILDENFEQDLRSVNTIDKNQKIIAGFLAFFALAILFMWSAQFKQNLTTPLNRKAEAVKKSSQEDDTCRGEDCQIAYQMSLKTKDTDEDGLTDWDELNIYRTSPYLDDSDSDGRSDGDEIDAESDPNCPHGFNCGLLSDEFGSGDEKDMIMDVVQNGVEQSSGASTEVGPEQAMQDLLEGRGDPAILRQLLLDSGMEKSMVDQFSDEDLLGTYKDVLNPTN